MAEYYLPQVQLAPPFRDYYVTKEGHIFSTKWGKVKRVGAIGQSGYEQITLAAVIDGKKERLATYTHRLVCMAYHGPAPSEDHIVAHLNGDKLDNRPQNLRWSLPKTNRIDDVMHRTIQTLRSVRRLDSLPNWTSRPALIELIREVELFQMYIRDLEDDDD